MTPDDDLLDFKPHRELNPVYRLDWSLHTRWSSWLATVALAMFTTTWSIRPQVAFLRAIYWYNACQHYGEDQNLIKIDTVRSKLEI